MMLILAVVKIPRAWRSGQESESLLLTQNDVWWKHSTKCALWLESEKGGTPNTYPRGILSAESTELIIPARVVHAKSWIKPEIRSAPRKPHTELRTQRRLTLTLSLREDHAVYTEIIHGTLKSRVHISARRGGASQHPMNRRYYTIEILVPNMHGVLPLWTFHPSYVGNYEELNKPYSFVYNNSRFRKTPIRYGSYESYTFPRYLRNEEWERIDARQCVLKQSIYAVMREHYIFLYTV